MKLLESHHGCRTDPVYHEARRGWQKYYWQDLFTFESNGLQIVASKMARLSDSVAGGFYAEHEGRPFFPP